MWEQITHHELYPNNLGEWLAICRHIMDIVSYSWADTGGSQHVQTSIFFQDEIGESFLSHNQEIFRHFPESARGEEINMRRDWQVYILWLEFINGIYINTSFV